MLYKGHVTNGCVRRKIPAAVEESHEILAMVKKWKLMCFGHISKSSGLAKTYSTRRHEMKKKKRQTEAEVGRQY